MRITRPITLFAGASLLALSAVGTTTAVAQETPPPHRQLEKTIGQAQPQIVPSLIVLNARSASLDGTTLTLSGASGSTIIFADRPVRAAGHSPTTDLISEWGEGSDSFAADPPNATVSVFDESGDSIGDIVVTLKAPRMDGDTITFDVDVLEGDLYGLTGPAAVFIDIIGRPLTPMSYAGVARRTTARAAMYTGAATDAALAATDPLCGYYPYPPCR
jgi:hypothetical protein